MKSKTLLLMAIFSLSPLSLLAPLYTALATDKIGVILPLSGDFARYGEKLRAALESKRSHTVEYLYEDEGCNPRTAVSAFRKLNSANGIKIFLGPWCGSPQVAIASLLERSNSFAILGSSAPERVFDLSGGRMLSVQPSIESESTFNAREAYRLGARRVVIVFLENDFSRAHEAAFRKAFQGEVLETLVYSSPDGSALRGLATKIKQLKPDTLYIPDAFPLMHGLTKQLASLGLQDLRLMSVYSAQSQDVLDAVGASGEGLILSYPKIEGESLQHYPALAAQVLISAIEKCSEKTTACLQQEIRAQHSFNEHGVLRGELGLKVIHNGTFVWMQ